MAGIITRLKAKSRAYFKTNLEYGSNMTCIHPDQDQTISDTVSYKG